MAEETSEARRVLAVIVHQGKHAIIYEDQLEAGPVELAKVRTARYVVHDGELQKSMKPIRFQAKRAGSEWGEE